MLLDLIVLCLNTAVKDQMSSIAFPTIGCGKMRFNPAMVAECFKAAKRDTDAALTVYHSCIRHYFQSFARLVCIVSVFCIEYHFLTVHIWL